MIPLKNSLILAQEYGDKLLTGSMSDADLNKLLSHFKAHGDHQHHKSKFNKNDYSTLEAMKDFIDYIGPHLNTKALYKLIEQLVPIEGELTRKQPTLLKNLLAYTANRDGLSNDLWKPFNRLLNAVFPKHTRKKPASMEDMKAVSTKWNAEKAQAFLHKLNLPDGIKALYQTQFMTIVKKQAQITIENPDELAENPAFRKSFGDSIFFNVVIPALMLNIPTNRKRTYADIIFSQLKADPAITERCATQALIFDASKLPPLADDNNLEARSNVLAEHTQSELDRLYPELSFNSEFAFTQYVKLCKEIIETINNIEKQLPKQSELYKQALPKELIRLRDELKRLHLDLDSTSSHFAKHNTEVILDFIQEIPGKLPQNLRANDSAMKKVVESIKMKIVNAVSIITQAQQPPSDRFSP